MAQLLIFYQKFRNLYAVCGCTLANLVAAAPQAQTVVIREIRANTSNIHKILIGGQQGHGVFKPVKLIYKFNSGRACNYFASLIYCNLVLETKRDGNRVASHNRDSSAGTAYFEIRQMHYPSALILHFHFL